MQKTWQDMSGQSHSHPHLEPSSSQRPPSPPSSLGSFFLFPGTLENVQIYRLNTQALPTSQVPEKCLELTGNFCWPRNPPLRLPSPPWSPILYQIWRKKTLQWHIWSTTTFSLSNSWSSIHLVLQPTICDDCWDVGVSCQDDLGDMSLLQRKMQMSVKTELATTSTPCIRIRGMKDNFFKLSIVNCDRVWYIMVLRCIVTFIL